MRNSLSVQGKRKTSTIKGSYTKMTNPVGDKNNRKPGKVADINKLYMISFREVFYCSGIYVHSAPEYVRYKESTI